MVYSDLYVCLEDGSAIRLTGWTVEFSSAPRSAQPPRYESFAEVIGSRVVDILESEGDAIVQVPNGWYVENAIVAGGSRAILGSFAEWTPEERAVPLRSWVTGELVSIAET